MEQQALVKRGNVDVLKMHSHTEIMETAKVLAESGAFPTIAKAQQAYAVMIIGQSFGMPPGEALMAISLVQGKPSFDVHWQAKRIIELGHHYEIVRLDMAQCTIRAWRRIGAALRESGEVSMTMDRAKEIAIHDKQQEKEGKGRLGNKWNYKSWAEDMLYAYCMRRVVRRYFPEVLGGYAPPLDDELAGMDEEGIVEGEVVTAEKIAHNIDELYGEKTDPTAPTTEPPTEHNQETGELPFTEADEAALQKELFAKVVEMLADVEKLGKDYPALVKPDTLTAWKAALQKTLTTAQLADMRETLALVLEQLASKQA